MKTLFVDVYKECGHTPPAGAAGELACYLPQLTPAASAGRKRPAVLILPGGGYHRVSPRESEPVALRFAAAGWAAFVLRYSCAPHAFPTALREAGMAMRYLRTHAEGLGIDPGMVAALGFSAGGHLCGTLGMLYDAPELADVASPADLRPDALVLCYPVAVSWGATHGGSFDNISRGDAALRARLSLDRLVRPDMPPVFLWHTRDDQAVPCRNSVVLAAALAEAGVDFELHVYHHGPHGLSTADATVYPAGAVPPHSRSINAWPEQAMDFLQERGFAIADAEV